MEVPSTGATIEQVLADQWQVQYLRDADDYCHQCSQAQSQSKHVQLERWPRVLVLHLKRWTVVSQWPFVREKNATPVGFEVSLAAPGKLFPYRLRAVLLHHGQAGGGHYTALVRSADNQWYHCDDALPPKRVPVADVLSAEAYMLFYEA